MPTTLVRLDSETETGVLAEALDEPLIGREVVGETSIGRGEGLLLFEEGVGFEGEGLEPTAEANEEGEGKGFGEIGLADPAAVRIALAGRAAAAAAA